MPFEKGNTIMLGRKLSEGTRQKMRESHKKLKPSDWGAGFKRGNIPWNKQSSIARNAYFAGLTDGEGHIGIYGNAPDKTRYGRVIVRIALTYGNILFEDAQKKWGGYIYNRQGKHLPYKEWQLQHEKAEIFLKDILPFLRIKKEQAKIALKYRWLQNRKKNVFNRIEDHELKYRKELEKQIKKLHKLLI